MKFHFSGLTDAEVSERIRFNLTNKKIPVKTKTPGEIIAENSFSIFNLVNLFIISLLLFFYFKWDDARLLWDSAGIIIVVFFNTVIAIVQEYRASKSIQNLELLKNEPVTVVRNSNKIQIDRHDIVRDDVIFINKGEQVVVDGTVLASYRLELDESLLTGESIPVEKSTDDRLLSGSYCIYGSGYYMAEKLGDENHASKIISIAKKYKFTVSPLLKKINLIFTVSFLITIAAVIVDSLVTINTNGISIANVRKISAIAVSLVPEGLVFFSTVTFMIGILRIAKLGAIVQKVNAIDSFSSVQVVCMDKTGTLTKNKISISAVVPFVSGRTNEINKLLGTFSLYSTDKNATIRALTKFDSITDTHWEDEIPFSSVSKMSVLKLKINGESKIFILGAYDVLLSHISERDKAEEILTVNRLEGYRNLLFGEADVIKPLDNKFTEGLSVIPLCLVSMKDEAREDATEAIRLFEKNNILCKVISGDSADAVKAALKEIGWEKNENEYISGEELNKLKGDEYKKAVLERNVFSRLSPEDKRNIVKELKRNNLETAVIGDGVNDLPAIKEADLGIAMEEGSAVTKDASDIILLNNKFTILPEIFSEGNRIINTVLYVSRLILVKNTVILILAVLSWLSVFNFPFTPRSSSLVNLLAAGLPAYFIALLNTNIIAEKRFFPKLLSFTVFSSLIIAFNIFLSDYLGRGIFSIEPSQIPNFLIVITTLMLIFNFLSSLINSSINDVKLYFIFTGILIAVYFFLIISGSGIPHISIISTFYEISPLTGSLWINVFVMIIPGVLILWVLHYLLNRSNAKARAIVSFSR